MGLQSPLGTFVDEGLLELVLAGEVSFGFALSPLEASDGPVFFSSPLSDLLFLPA